MKVETDDLISIPDAAKRRGVRRQALHARIAKKDIKLIKIGKFPFLFKSEVDALKIKEKI